MTDQEKNRQVAKISIFITSIFVIFLSISYAFINQTLTGTKRQVITSGNLELELKEGEAITLENALPMYDEVGMLQESFEFKLINKTNTDTNYTLKLVDITSDGVQKLDTSYVKYGLIKGEEDSKIDFLSELNADTIDQGIILGNETIDYALRLWIDSSVEDETLIKDKSLSYRIDVVADQIKQISYKGMMESRGIEETYLGGGNWEMVPSTKKYYQYSAQISHIVIENKINIPDTIETDKQWDVSEKQDGTVMAYLEKNESEKENEDIYRLHIQANGKVRANPDCSSLFSNFLNIEQFDGLENFDTSNAINMSSMFEGYNGSAPLDLSNFNTSNVTNMSAMFKEYSSSAPLDLSNFNTSNVTNMTLMFSYYSSSAPLDLSNFNTSNVTNMSYMFSDYSSNTPLDLSNFNTSNITYMSGMFYNYSSSQSLDLSNLNTSNITDMDYMFFGYSSNAPLDLSNFNTSNVTNMNHMFSDYSSSQPLDLSNFDTSNVTDISWMFAGYSSVAKLVIGSFNISKVTDMSDMFYRDSDYYASPILVKDEAMKAWVLEQNPNLNNVIIMES